MDDRVSGVGKFEREGNGIFGGWIDNDRVSFVPGLSKSLNSKQKSNETIIFFFCHGDTRWRT